MVFAVFAVLSVFADPIEVSEKNINTNKMHKIALNKNSLPGSEKSRKIIWIFLKFTIYVSLWVLYLGFLCVNIDNVAHCNAACRYVGYDYGFCCHGEDLCWCGDRAWIDL